MSLLEDNQKKCMELLKIRPMTPSQVADQMKLTREHVSRNIIAPLLEIDKIVKVEGTHNYQLKGQSLGVAQVQRLLINESKISECISIQNMMDSSKPKQAIANFEIMKGICLGTRIGIDGKFKINPDAWIHPQDTKVVTDLLRLHYGSKLIHYAVRMALRSFLSNGIKVHLSDGEYKQFGLVGDKVQPKTATLHIKKEQYDQCKELLRDNLKEFAKFGFQIWTGARPSVILTTKCDQLQFYDRTTLYLKIGNEKTSNKEVIKFSRLLMGSNFDESMIITETKRAVKLNVVEYKTDDQGKNFPKYIFDEDFAKALEIYVQKRKNQGYEYLFWDDNKTEFNFMNYTDIVKTKVIESNNFYKELFLKVGFSKSDFGVFFRANYGFRHMAIQTWLQAFDYNYSKVAPMFHEDEATLKKYYGEKTLEKRDSDMGEVSFD